MQERKNSEQIRDIAKNIPEAGVRMNKENLLKFSEVFESLETTIDILMGILEDMEKEFEALHENEHSDNDKALNTLGKVSDILDKGLEEVHEYAISKSSNGESAEDG